MTNQGQSYLLEGGAAELERLRLQARVWEPEAEAMLDRIGVPEGAACLDLSWEVKMPPQSGTFKQAQRVTQVAEQQVSFDLP